MTCPTGPNCHRSPTCKDVGCPGREIMGYEAALPADFAEHEPEAPRRGTDWQAVVVWLSVSLCFTAVLALSVWKH